MRKDYNFAVSVPGTVVAAGPMSILWLVEFALNASYCASVFLKIVPMFVNWSKLD